MSVFDMIAPTRIDRSKFDVSDERIFSLDMGQLIPFMVKECAPNDRWQISNSMVLRMLPMLSPVLADINVYCHYFFVPSRYLLTDDEGKWSDFISGGKDGMSTVTLPEWKTGISDTSPLYASNGLPVGSCSYSLWDYLGLPVNKLYVSGHAPLDLPRRAYVKIYNDWYRDPLLQPNEIPFTEDGTHDTFAIQFRNLHKDYFISALKQPQLGTAPTLPIEGNLFVQYLSEAQSTGLGNSVGVSQWYTNGSQMIDVPNYSASVNTSLSSAYGTQEPAGTAVFKTMGGSNSSNKPLYVDLGNSVSSNVNELRILYATQRFMERNNVAGGCVDPSRYGDFLLAHWGIRPADVELGRSEYIGGSKNPFLVGEVAQTSESTDTSAQGNLSGSGMCAGRNFICNYTCKEFGYIIGIMSIMPNQFYHGGVERLFLKYDKTDFLIPEFVNCGETAIYKSQLYYNGSFDPTDTDEIFGYQGLYDEYRSAHDIVCGGMTDQSFEYWHLARMFDSQPELNADFISGKWLSDTAGKRIFSVQESDLNSVTAQRAIIAHVRNQCIASRALPYYPL